MKIALIADIHGNAVALEAVLADIAKERVDQIICLGDVAIGPQPKEVLQRVHELRCPVVMGNGDAALLDPTLFNPTNELMQKFKDIQSWCRESLSKPELDFHKTFQPTISIELNERLLCYHGSPRSYDDIIRSTTPDAELDPMFENFDAKIYAGGHTHTAMLRRFKSALLINAGSVGLPFHIESKRGKIVNPPWGEYALLSAPRGSFHVEFRRVMFDAHKFIQAVLQSGMPHAEFYVADWQQG